MSLIDELRALEVSMLSPVGRFSSAELKRLLTEDFREFGSSGVVYDRETLIDVLMKEGEQPFAPIEISDFAVQEVAPDVALATYRSMREGQMRLRSSLWRRENVAWRMVFHQATPTAI